LLLRILTVLIASGLVGAAVLAQPAGATEPAYTLTIKDHRFAPDTLEIPANVRAKLMIKNADPTPEEFDSDSLHREKVIPGGTEGIVFVGPLEPGSYAFMGEYHMDTAKGRVIAK
jgi:Cupredoxin-like domain